MLRTCRSPLKPTGVENVDSPSKLKSPMSKKSTSTSTPTKSSVVNRVLPVIVGDNKENADPVATLADTDDEFENDGDDKNSSASSDGFNISEDFHLDNENDDGGVAFGGGSSDAKDTKRSSTTSASEAMTDDESSPFLSSLMKNRMVLSMDKATTLKLMSSEEGSSPALDSTSRIQSIVSPLAARAGNSSGTSSRLGGFSKFRRCISMVERASVPASPDQRKPVASLLDFTSPVSRNTFKRPAVPPNPDELCQAKKPRTDSNESGGLPRLTKSASCLSSPMINSIMTACTINDRSNVTADGSCQLSLPTMQGYTKNNDLNNIDCHVMAKLLNGDFADKVASFRVIDARYSYEFEGGHIAGAENFGLWDEKRFMDEFFPESLGPKQPTAAPADGEPQKVEPRNILIFHCEFSSARGPALLRALRKKDRELNNETYPALHYPECYLLHDGYKTFYANYPQLCEPQSYIPMAHPGYISEERKFHKKARTWAAGGGGGNTVARTGASSRLLKL